MSIWNKILIGLVFVAAVAFFYLAARTLQTHKHWREKAQKFEARIIQTEEENVTLVEADGSGPDGKQGIRPLRRQLHRLLIDRGRVWYNCSPGRPDAATGHVTVTTDQPDPHGISDKTVLYAFEETDLAQKGSYLGEFKVTKVGQKTVDLDPTIRLEPGSGELQRLAASAGPWTLYEVMPIDNRTTFAGMDEGQLNELLPAERVPEYLNDGQTISTEDVERLELQGRLLAVDDKGQIVYEDDTGQAVNLKLDDNGNAVFEYADGQTPEKDKVRRREVQQGSGKYVRQLRDCAILFKDYYLQFSVLRDRIVAATQDKQYVDAALADARLQQQRRQAEKAGIQVDLDEVRRELAAVTGLHGRLKQSVDGYRAAIDRIIAGNKATAGQIAKHQLDAARRIDERTRRMAQSGANTN